MIYGERVRFYNPAVLSTVKPVRPPRAGKDWSPIKHSDLVDVLLDTACRFGYQIEGGIKYALSGNNNADMTFAMPVQARPNKGQLFTPYLTVFNSNTGRHRLKVYYGGVVHREVGLPYAWVTETADPHRHTKGDWLQLYAEHILAPQRVKDMCERLTSMINEYESIPITRAEIDSILMTAGRQGLVASSRVFHAAKELPREATAVTVNDLMAAFSRVVGRWNAPRRQPDAIFEFIHLLPGITMNQTLFGEIKPDLTNYQPRMVMKNTSA